MKLPSLLLNILKVIASKKGRGYLVGGCVRDDLLNIKESHDKDVEIYGLEPEELKTILSSFGRVLEVGKSFGVYKLKELPDVDFALARKESKCGSAHQDFAIELIPELSFQEACKRRDLTINAILYDPIEKKWIDPYHGKEDLKNKILRMVDESTFKDDPLRVLRLARFKAKLPDFKIEEKTMIQARAMVKDLPFLSKERIFNEYNQILMNAMPSAGFTFLHAIQALPPELEILSNTFQRLDFHPEGSVFNHTMLVVDLAALCKQKTSWPLAFMWASLLHDIGKPKVTTPEGKAPNHDLEGEPIAYEFMMNLSHQQKLSKYVSLMVRTHMTLMVACRKDHNVYPYLKVLKRLEGNVEIDDLVLLSRCDKLGRKRIDIQTIQKFNHYIDNMKKMYGSHALKPVITGYDLIEMHIQPQDKYKELLDDLYDRQLKGKTKEQLIDYIKDLIKRGGISGTR